MLPGAVKERLMKHLEDIRRLHRRNLEEGAGTVALPDILILKVPNACREWGWQWVFPASGCYFDREAGVKRRHHIRESVIQKAMKEEVRRAGITKAATPHTMPQFRDASARSWLRHSHGSEGDRNQGEGGGNQTNSADCAGSTSRRLQS
jgi:hypothetical protein